MKTVRFGIIGGGLMGREFACAAARWCQLQSAVARPQLVAVCSRSESSREWFTSRFADIKQSTHDYNQLLANDDVEAVYVAVPHHLHARCYADAVRAGKHVMGEKPFGIDRDANRTILAALDDHPDVFARCASQFPFFPAVQRVGRLLEAGELGRIIEAETGFLHASDLNPDKPINWKRQVAFNGAYGVMGDLGMHTCHVPLRAGWRPREVTATLSNLFANRRAAADSDDWIACDTWDHAVCLIETEAPHSGDRFPWVLRTSRIAPGQRNTWYLRIMGDRGAVRYSTADPGRLDVIRGGGGAESWQAVQCGFETAYPTITGAIFEFGFTDAVLQMWASFLHELAGGEPPSPFAGCLRPDETAFAHDIFTAALRSHEQSRNVALAE